MSATTIPPVKGIRLASAAAGIRYADRQDLVLMEIAAGASCAAVFTTNAFCAAPVVVAREHLEAAAPRYLLINSGNANAGTGRAGLQAARQSCRLVAESAGCAEQQVLPFSTGVIGEDLPLRPIAAAIPQLLENLGTAGWENAAHAIMTTDTVPKMASRELEIDGSRVTLSGICKGSGMIRPEMATMLAFIATDAMVPAELLRGGLQRAVAPSFNSITVDGDTSTNDACVLVATGAAGAVIDSASSGPFFAALEELCMELARAIVKDGEGATKLVEIRVESASSRREARHVAYTIAHSPLVKTALYASDPNWGRILAAVGRAGIAALDIERVSIWLDDLRIVSGGGRDPGYSEAAGQRVMQRPELTIRVDLGRGGETATVLTCDLSHDYVRINAEYRT